MADGFIAQQPYGGHTIRVVCEAFHNASAIDSRKMSFGCVPMLHSGTILKIKPCSFRVGQRFLKSSVPRLRVASSSHSDPELPDTPPELKEPVVMLEVHNTLWRSRLFPKSFGHRRPLL